MKKVQVIHEGSFSLEDRIKRHSFPQGGIEYQNDLPHHVHSWHKHSVHERLIIHEGDMTVEWTDNETINKIKVYPGDVIELPAETAHQSTAGIRGCTYLIRPENGKAAKTSPSAPRTLQ